MEKLKKVKICLAGNPNCGKSSLFNNITGLRQHVGNYPGVTVEKKEAVVTKKSVLGDPIEVTIRGYNLSLRKDEASQIVVED